MRQWQARADAASWAGAALGGMVRGLGEPQFPAVVLEALQPLVPAASWSVYRTGRHCRPSLFLSASRGVPDRTRDCWWAYLSGPYLHDSSFGGLQETAAAPLRLCHIRSDEVAAEHRARVYEAHGVAERVSVVDQEGDAVFAVNFYRHAHQAPFTDAQIAAFDSVALPVLELARKHIALAGGGQRLVPAAALPEAPEALPSPGCIRERLLGLAPELTLRELDVCVRLLQGMTHDGIAADLGLGLTTVKTYRNRAFTRLGIHFRNELFARVLR